MQIINCEQRSPEWFIARLSVDITASEVDKLVTTSGEPSKQREKLLWKKAGEKVAGQPEESYQNQAMLTGIEREDTARQLYQIMNDCIVTEAGLCVHDKLSIGCSPDGLIGQSGGLEIKCPNCSTHVGYILGNCLPTDYFQQVQSSLFVTGFEWWDFMSYYPGIKPFIIRVIPDKKFHKSLKTELEKFSVDLNEVIRRIK